MTDKKDNNELDIDKTLVETTHKVEDFYFKFKKQINYTVIGVLGAIALYVAYSRFYVAPMEIEAQKESFMAQRLFEMDSFNLALNGNDKFKGFETIADEYGLTKMGNLAHYYAGICLLRTGKFEEAKDQLEDFSTSNAIIGPLATAAIGDAEVELGNLDRGAKQYVKAAKMSDNKLTSPIFYKKAGVVYESLKEYDNAMEMYKKVKSDYPDTQEAADIDKYITRAEALSKSEM